MTTSETVALLIPEIILIAAATGLYMIGAFARLRDAATWIAVGAIVLAGVATYTEDGHLGFFGESPSVSSTLNGPLVVDLFGHTVRWAILVFGELIVLLTANARGSQQRCEE